ncbi:MAG: N-acetylglucosamine-6-phosphate deacetylase [Victivallaceae bacterium]|nr:N-acetylglucosamine-6-phosphate deacetylase [Victivallaceae bacterium]
MDNEKKPKRTLYLADSVLTPDRDIRHGAVLCEGSRILAIGGESGFTPDGTFETVRFDNAYITPGFIDTHIHGAGGCDCSNLAESPRTLDDMSEVLGRNGVTTFFPSVVSDTPERMLANLEKLVREMRRPLRGAEAVGINVVGPFLNPERRGAHAAEAVRPIDVGLAREIVTTGDGLVRLMTFAPELPGARELIEYLVSAGVQASMGYSLADGDEVLAAIDAGASHCTHLFNGMRPLHQRDIGLAAIVLTSSKVAAELIIDERHIHPRMVDVACRCKMAHRIIGVSCGTMAFGAPDGIKCTSGPVEIKARDGYVKTDDDTIAGAMSMLNTGWRSLKECGHLAETRSAQAVTINPAKTFGMNDRGTLLPGHRADMAVFRSSDCENDHANELVATIRNGEVIFRK